jgi:hypothetical protein
LSIDFLFLDNIKLKVNLLWKKFLIVNFKDRGGRELETSLLQMLLSNKYFVDISTDDMIQSLQVFKNYNKGYVTSLKNFYMMKPWF